MTTRHGSPARRPPGRRVEAGPAWRPQHTGRPGTRQDAPSEGNAKSQEVVLLFPRLRSGGIDGGEIAVHHAGSERSARAGVILARRADTRGVAAGVQARNRLAAHMDDLALLVDLETALGAHGGRHDLRRIVGRLVDRHERRLVVVAIAVVGLVLELAAVELRVDAGIGVGVPAFDLRDKPFGIDSERLGKPLDGVGLHRPFGNVLAELHTKERVPHDVAGLLVANEV